MSEAPADVLRTIAFGALDGGLWGCAWGTGDGVAALGAQQTNGDPEAVRVTISGEGSADEWTLTGEALELTVAAAGGAVAADDLGGGFDQLCRVRGRARIGDVEQPIDCLGRRAARAGIDIGGFDSVRDLSGWFDAGEGLALTALRPRRPRGHERDIVAACVFEPDGPSRVADPRLSSTYAGDGRLLRTGVELWLSEDEEEDQYPRRAAGDALGAAARMAYNGLDLQAWPIRWHSRGLEGTGVYILARPR